jgi:hypothetical protein
VIYLKILLLDPLSAFGYVGIKQKILHAKFTCPVKGLILCAGQNAYFHSFGGTESQSFDIKANQHNFDLRF